MQNVMTLYTQKNTIGKGTFGKVKLGIHKDSGEKAAIKILEKSKIITKDDEERVEREIKILNRLSHLNVVKIFAINETKERYYIFMEYCNRGELFNYIVDKQHLSEDEASYFYYQLINGLEYIHSQNIVHRDLKPENLLLSKGNILKIIDFGLSNFYLGKPLSTPCGSPCYASPEMVSGHKYNGFRIDVWSTGIILYAMIYGYLPFEDPDNEMLFQKILECKPDMPSGVSTTAVDLMKRIMVTNPDKRITVQQIKEHPFYLKGKEIFNQKHPMLNVSCSQEGKYALHVVNPNNSAKLLKKKELNLNNVINNDNNYNSNNSISNSNITLHKEHYVNKRECLYKQTSNIKHKHNSNNSNNENNGIIGSAVSTTINMKIRDKTANSFYKSTLTNKNNCYGNLKTTSRKEQNNIKTNTSPVLLKHEFNNNNKTNRILSTQQCLNHKKQTPRSNTVNILNDNRLSTEHDIIDKGLLLSLSPQNNFRKTETNVPLSSPTTKTKSLSGSGVRNSTSTQTQTNNKSLSKRMLTSIQRTDLNAYRRSFGHHYHHKYQHPLFKCNNQLHQTQTNGNSGTIINLTSSSSSSSKPLHELHNYNYKPAANGLFGFPLSSNSRTNTITTSNRPVSSSTTRISYHNSNSHVIKGNRYNRSHTITNKAHSPHQSKEHKSIIINLNIAGQNVTTQVNVNNTNHHSTYHQSYTINSASQRNNKPMSSSGFSDFNKKMRMKSNKKSSTNNGVTNLFTDAGVSVDRNNQHKHKHNESMSKKRGMNFRGKSGYMNTEHGERGSFHYNYKYSELFGGNKKTNHNNNTGSNILNVGPVIIGNFPKNKK